MRMCCFVLLLPLLASCSRHSTPPVVASASQPELRAAFPTSSFGAAVWTGDMVVESRGRITVAYDPARGEVRDLAQNAAAPEEPIFQGLRLIRLDANRLGTAYLTPGDDGSLCIDIYRIDHNQWSRLTAIPRSKLPRHYEDWSYQADGQQHKRSGIDLACLVCCGDEIIVFISPATSGEPTMAVRVKPDGTWRPLSEEQAPAHGVYDTAVYAYGGQILYWGYARVDTNIWSVWDSKTDKWLKPAEFDRAYSFGHCQVGDTVYIFGGAESSAYGLIKQGGWVYSFTTGEWKRWPMDGGPEGRRDATVCWTGQEVLVWGGDAGVGSSKMLFGGFLNTGFAYNPATQKWRAMTRVNAPTFTQPVSWAVWTGEELLVCGIQFQKGSEPRLIIAAYSPWTDSWRTVRDVPMHAAS